MAGSSSTSSTSRGQAAAAGGQRGYEIVHTSPGLEVGVYVLVAPEPDRQQHEDDEVYIVLEGPARSGRGRGDRPRRGPGDVRRRPRRAPLHRLRAPQPARHLHPADVTPVVAATGAGVARLDSAETPGRSSSPRTAAASPAWPAIPATRLPRRRRSRNRRLEERRRRWSWERLDFPHEDVFSVAVSGADGAIYAGCEPSMLFVNRDRGESWTELRACGRSPRRRPGAFRPALDVARALDRAEPARRAPPARRDRAGRRDAK